MEFERVYILFFMFLSMLSLCVGGCVNLGRSRPSRGHEGANDATREALPVRLCPRALSLGTRLRQVTVDKGPLIGITD